MCLSLPSVKLNNLGTLMNTRKRKGRGEGIRLALAQLLCWTLGGLIVALYVTAFMVTYH